MTLARAVRVYCWVLGAGLLLEGAGLLLLQAFNLYQGDVRHNALHAIWGVAILVLVKLDRAIQTALVFGVFYTALGVLGVVTTDPFGLQLGPGENVFHFIVGPLALALGVRAQRASSRASISANNPSTSGSTSST